MKRNNFLFNTKKFHKNWTVFVTTTRRLAVPTIIFNYGSNISAEYDPDRVTIDNVRHIQNFRTIWLVGYFL
jgi:hypothetical protein